MNCTYSCGKWTLGKLALIRSIQAEFMSRGQAAWIASGGRLLLKAEKCQRNCGVGVGLWLCMPAHSHVLHISRSKTFCAERCIFQQAHTVSFQSEMAWDRNTRRRVQLYVTRQGLQTGKTIRALRTSAASSPRRFALLTVPLSLLCVHLFYRPSSVPLRSPRALSFSSKK